MEAMTLKEKIEHFISSDMCKLENFTDIEICSKDNFNDAIDIMKVILNEYSEDEIKHFYNALFENNDFDEIVSGGWKTKNGKFLPEHFYPYPKWFVTEVCPHCDKENTIEWNVEEYGYEAWCPHCGKKMMLCSECLYAKDNMYGRCDWNSESKKCFRCKPRKAIV